MNYKVKEIAGLVNGIVDGNPESMISSVSKIEEGVVGSLSFLANPLYTNFIYSTNATAVIVNKDFHPEKELSCTLIKVEDAYTAFAKLLDMYNKMTSVKKGVSEKASIDESAELGVDVYIGDFTFIGENVKIASNVQIYPQCYIGDNVIIDSDTIIYPGVKIYADCQVGSNCTIHAGVVVGGDGFGFAPQDNKDYIKVAQIGNVIIEENVEIGANTTIDRATLGSTIIRKGVKLDNMIQIGHNVEIGQNTVIASQTGVSGSTKIGKNCLIGGQVGFVGHISIADNVKIAAQSGIGRNITQEGQVVQGSPCFDVSQYRKSYVHFRNLSEIVKKVDKMEQQVLENRNK